MTRIWGWFVIGAVVAYQAQAAQGRGGSFMQMHTSSLSRFSSDITGSPIILGGMGCFKVAQELCVGGGGGATFLLLSGTQSSEFRMGFGGLYAEYPVLEWLHARIFAGGGGHRALSISGESNSQLLMKKISMGGFTLLQPSLNAQWSVSAAFSVGLNVGYFLTTVSELNSPTIGLTMLMSTKG